MKKLFFVAVCTAMLAACNPQVKNSDKIELPDAGVLQEELKNANAAFSKRSGEMGYKEALLTHIADDAIIMPEMSFPVMGADSIRAMLDRSKDLPTMTWEPEKIEVAASGELGYIFGSWKIAVPGPDGKELAIEGAYTSIWRKQAGQSWKIILNSGTTHTRPNMPQQKP